MALLGGLIAGGAALYNSFKDRDAAKDAAEASQFTPMGLSGPLGASSFDPQTGVISQNLGAPQAAIMDQLMNRSLAGFNVDPRLAELQGQGLGQIGGLFDQAQAVQMGLPAANQAFQAQQQGLFNQFQGLGAQGLGAAFGAPQAMSQVGSLFGMGRDLLGSDFRDIEAAELQRQRDLARPREENAVASSIDRLFGQGRLGTTGGADALGQISESLEMADLARVGQARQFAEGLRQQDRTLGSSLFGLGLQGLTADQALGINQGQLGSGLMSQLPGVGLNMFNAQGTTDQAMLNRAQQRLANAQGLFGFGQGATTDQFAQAGGLLGAGQSLGQSLNAQTQLGLYGGASAAQAGADAGRYFQAANTSPWATALQGAAVGGAFNPIGDAIGGLFNGGNV